MSLIKNLVKETENKPRKKKKNAGSDDDDAGEKDKPLGPFIKSATDLQRLKLEKLMKNPEKPVIIPEQRRERDYMSSVPTFVRNVMGSSAGAGSGEFHVYRHLRRKEYARQKNIQNQSLREAADDAYQQKLDDNKQKAEERTAKKRAKRLKKKQRAKRPREPKPKDDNKQPESESSASGSEEDEQPNEAAEQATSAKKPELKKSTAAGKPEQESLEDANAVEKPEAELAEIMEEADKSYTKEAVVTEPSTKTTKFADPNAPAT
ncbi:PRKR-interacting protein 1 homolog [Drosophila grimshawi]|uniref:GH22998 n=1 Tax=Drosophila grimshawi TaxID=7222 RepID=B4JWA0_DROGR|nr:PRKR-interacting protein 1 homolog [Drosophila grimshawi]EDV98238.1 GH22998 [Drosophila grimshawi]